MSGCRRIFLTKTKTEKTIIPFAFVTKKNNENHGKKFTKNLCLQNGFGHSAHLRCMIMADLDDGFQLRIEIMTLC